MPWRRPGTAGRESRSPRAAENDGSARSDRSGGGSTPPRLQTDRPGEAPEGLDGRLLVQRLVPVTAPGRLDTARTARIAGAVPHQLERAPQQRVQLPEALLSQARPSGHAVVDEDRRRAELGMPGVRDPADIAAVGDRQQGEEPDDRVLDGVDAAHEMEVAPSECRRKARRELDPEPHGLVDQRRKLEGVGRDRIATEQSTLLVVADAHGDSQAAQAHGKLADPPRAETLEDLGLFLPQDDRVVVDADRPGHRAAAFRVQLDDLVGSAAVQVDRPGMALVEHAHAVDLPQQLEALLAPSGSAAVSVAGHDRERLARRARVDVAVGPAPKAEPGRSRLVLDEFALLGQGSSQLQAPGPPGLQLGVS